jgi:hypothetical protein
VPHVGLNRGVLSPHWAHMANGAVARSASPFMDAAAPKSKYGVDPRSDGEAVVPDMDWWQSTYKAGKITRLSSVEKLQAALDAAAQDDQLVVLRFVRRGCAACASTKEFFAKKADEYSTKGQFWEVDFDDERDFCRQCALKFVPAAHIYRGDRMLASLPVGKKSWEAFAAELDEQMATVSC